MTLYHGSSAWEKILEVGFDLEHPRRSDPGDFGWGLYLSANPARARSYGKVLKVSLDPSRLAYISNPYFLDRFERVEPKTEEEKLFYGLVFDGDIMKTVNLPSDLRVAAAKLVRQVFLEKGYTGIRTSLDDEETVLFSLSAIQRVSL